jgi:cell division protein FtsB
MTGMFNVFRWQSQCIVAVLITQLPFQMATAGCALQADADAAQDDSASTYQLGELVKQHALAHLQQELPDLLGQIFSATGFLFSEESGRGLAKVTASSCLSTSIALCTLDAVNPFFEFANGVCDVDPETRCANGGPTWADLERRKPDLTQVLEESKSFMTNQTFWAPIFAELRARGHHGLVERIEPWTTGSIDVASSVPPLAAGATYESGVGSSGSRLVRFVALMGIAVTAIVAIRLYIRSATDVTNQEFVPNIVATPGAETAIDPDAPIPATLDELGRELDQLIEAQDGVWGQVLDVEGGKSLPTAQLEQLARQSATLVEEAERLTGEIDKIDSDPTIDTPQGIHAADQQVAQLQAQRDAVLAQIAELQAQIVAKQAEISALDGVLETLRATAERIARRYENLIKAMEPAWNPDNPLWNEIPQKANDLYTRAGQEYQLALGILRHIGPSPIP